MKRQDNNFTCFVQGRIKIMNKKISGILICTLLATSTFTIALMSNVVEASVTNYEITYVAQTGINQITVSVKAQFCSACNPNYLSIPGDPAFPTYTWWIDGRYVAVRIKDANTGAILGNIQKLVCNPTNWPLNDNNPRIFVFDDIILTGVSTVIVESDVYCSWCGHWYPAPKSMTVLPISICIDAGHSPTDSNSDKQIEYAINKGVGDKLKSKLEAYGVNVVFTDPDDDITERITNVNNLKPSLFISLHCNALEGFDNNGKPIGTAKGREVWFYDDTDSNNQAVNELDLAVRTMNGLTKETGKVFFYPTGTDDLGNYAGWLARDSAHGGSYTSGFYHIGKDIDANIGDLVYAISDGTVIDTVSGGWGSGNTAVQVRHTLADGSQFIALYGHVISSVNVGEEIKAGTPIATIGSYDPPHLHFGVHPGSGGITGPLGRMPNEDWPDDNGFVDPIGWITSNAPDPNKAREPIPKEKQNPWPTGIPILKGITVCPAILHEMEFFDFFGSLSYKCVSYQNMLALLNSNNWREDAAQGIYNGIIGYIEEKGATINGKCPIDLIITDPDNLKINNQINEIPGATYTEIDLDGDGDLDDQVRIPDRKIGSYSIEIIPEPGAQPTDTYTLEISLFGITYVLAENIQIVNIPSEPYIIESTESGIILPETDNTPPSIIISASPSLLWPPNHKMIKVSINGSATDTGSGIASITFSVDDEYNLIEPTLTGFDQIIQLEAWRYGYDMDGRTYTITATATDHLGNVATTSIVVLVPHDQGN
jgi:N-acetylmuramoyl-L-alanine amidase